MHCVEDYGDNRLRQRREGKSLALFRSCALFYHFLTVVRFLQLLFLLALSVVRPNTRAWASRAHLRFDLAGSFHFALDSPAVARGRRIRFVGARDFHSSGSTGHANAATNRSRPGVYPDRYCDR